MAGGEKQNRDGAGRGREARLAERLRDNLRRRKRSPEPAADDRETPEEG